ncbi:MAG TPA: RND transporter, partial [bacterium]|nr:RND transporter [bacterium]
TILRNTGRFTYKNSKLVLAFVVLCVVVAGYGISQIQINDNPTRWFAPSHPIRVADRVLNSHFGGTYTAYLALEPSDEHSDLPEYVSDLGNRLYDKGTELESSYPGSHEIFRIVREKLSMLVASVQAKHQLLDALSMDVNSQLDTAPDELYDAWDQASLFLEIEKQRDEVFKQPEALAYISRLQEALLETGIVGKSNSLSDIVKTVYRELLSGKDEDFRIPESPNGVAQCLITYQNSHRNQDLWHFVTPDHRKSVLWIQLKSGDNKDMTKVVSAMEQFIAANPAPFGITHHWFGLTYINVIWQEKMVTGMLQSFFGSFFIVLLMMIFMFQSGLWGLLSMIPLTVTIALIYGVIGLVGKDYDMPV